LVATTAKDGSTARLASLVVVSLQLKASELTQLAVQQKHNAHQHHEKRKAQKELAGKNENETSRMALHR